MAVKQGVQRLAIANRCTPPFFKINAIVIARAKPEATFFAVINLEEDSGQLFKFFWPDDGKYPGDVKSQENVPVKPASCCFRDDAFHVFPH